MPATAASAHTQLQHALIADQYVRLPHKNNQRARIAELRTRTLARAPNRAREARSGRCGAPQRPSTHSTRTLTLWISVEKPERVWCFLAVPHDPTTTTPHTQGASGYKAFVRRRALPCPGRPACGNAGRWLLGRSPLRSRCEVVCGKLAIKTAVNLTVWARLEHLQGARRGRRRRWWRAGCVDSAAQKGDGQEEHLPARRWGGRPCRSYRGCT